MVKFDTNHKNILRKCQEKFKQKNVANGALNLEFNLIGTDARYQKARLAPQPSKRDSTW